jgi:hypothetical protein
VLSACTYYDLHRLGANSLTFASDSSPIMDHHNTDARYSTYVNAHRDVHNHWHDIPHTYQNRYASSSSSWNQAPPPFIEIPVNLISSHFTGRDEELDRIGKALDMVNVYGSVPARCAVHGMTGTSLTTLIYLSPLTRFT